MINKDKARQIWREADAVCFDVDSTLVQDEGPFELSAFCGKAKEILELYRKSSDEDFQSNFEKGLNIVKPSLTQMKDFIVQRGVKLSPGAREIVELLHTRGCQVYLASNSFQRLTEPVAQQLNIPVQNIFSNQLIFDLDGYNKDAPTCKSGGKKLVAEILKQSHKKLVFIGDDVTDIEAKPPADCFIGYGGNINRDKVRENSDWFVTDLQELINELKKDS